jgi:hypothetical protein
MVEWCGMVRQQRSGLLASWSRLNDLRGGLTLVAFATLGAACVSAAPATDDLQRAATAYADAYNARDYDALAEQWIENAELVEGDGRLVGRAAIMRSLREWREAHPAATLRIDVAAAQPLTATLARVAGTMTFTPAPGAPAVTSQFTSLRTLSGGVWRIAESMVVSGHAAALDDLGWLVGSWETGGGAGGPAGTLTFEKQLGGFVLVGRGRFEAVGDAPVESLQVLHADRATGTVRCRMFDSTGAVAEGVVESDGTAIQQSFVGTPAESAAGRTARWVQLIAPAGAEAFTLHAVERTLDGVVVPDGAPLHFTRVK